TVWTCVVVCRRSAAGDSGAATAFHAPVRIFVFWRGNGGSMARDRARAFRCGSFDAGGRLLSCGAGAFVGGEPHRPRLLCSFRAVLAGGKLDQLHQTKTGGSAARGSRSTAGERCGTERAA